MPTWAPQVTIARNCRCPEVGTLGSRPRNHGVTIESNCRFQKVRTVSSQPGNRRLPLQRICGSEKLQLTVANLGTIGYHCKELPVLTSWNSRLPTWAPQVAIASNCRFPKVGTDSSQPGNHRLPLQRTSGSQKLQLTVANLGTIGYHSHSLELTVGNVGNTGYHCKELPVLRAWNSWLPTWEPQVTIASNCWFPEVGTNGSQPRNHGLPLQAIAASQKLELTFSKLSGYHCKELRVPKA